MKPYQVLLAFFLLAAANSFSQTIYVADKNPNAPTGDHVFATLQECIDIASDGDIIHVIPANDNYGSVTIDKELHIVGSGWIPDNQTGLKSRVYSIVFESNNANGSTLNGLILTQTNDYPVYFGGIKCSTRHIKRCGNLQLQNSRNKPIRQLSN